MLSGLQTVSCTPSSFLHVKRYFISLQRMIECSVYILP